MSGKDSLNGTYDQVAFTQRAVHHIYDHAANFSTMSLYIYLAYHNVHDACQNDRFKAGLNAPLETVELYPTTILDTWKVQAAMTTELDYGVGNVTAALKVGPSCCEYTHTQATTDAVILSFLLHVVLGELDQTFSFP